MAITTLSRAFTACHGRIVNLVLVNRYGRQYICAYVKPRNPNTPSQRAGRSSFADAVRSWQALAEEEKLAWTRKAKHLRMIGYNAFISKHIKQNILSQPQNPGKHDQRVFSRAIADGSPSSLHSSFDIAPFLLPNRSIMHPGTLEYSDYG